MTIPTTVSASVRRRLFITFFSGFCLLPARAQSQTAPVSELRHAEEQMHDAYVHHKTGLFASLYADDATFIYNSGKLVGKVDRVARFDSAAAFQGEQDVIQRIRLFGDVGVVTCLTTYPNAQKTDMTALIITRVWQRRSGRWQVVSFQSTKTAMPEGASTAQADRITFAQP